MKNTFINCEEELQDRIIGHSSEISCSFPDSPNSFLGKEFPFLHDREYFPHHYSHLGKGDLIFTDGQKRFLVVETKYLNPRHGKTARAKRNKYRKKVQAQAIKYAKYFQKQCPDADVYYAVITNESLAGVININPLNGESVTDVKRVSSFHECQHVEA